MKPLLALAIATTACTAWAQPQVYSIDLNQPLKPLTRGHLDLGGKAPNGGTIAVNSYYIEKDGRPFVPIVGEMHYSRYPAAEWEESLRRMKAGGINTVSTYVFWNLHERVEGQFDWSGDLNLRHFVELCAKVELNVIVRVGPFAHGEIRNGGLPDWLYGRALEVRSNDAAYLAYAETLYGQIGAQLKGLFYQDGGPILGLQLENEFQHSAAPWEIRYDGAPLERTVAERDAGVIHAGVAVSEAVNQNAGYGRDHMANLKLIAKRAGLDAPIYTAAGWGNAAIVPRGSLPVTAAYPFPFWGAPKPSPFYLFTDLHAAPDYSPVSFESSLYPSIPAELGGGIQPTYSRRPYVPDESIEPLIVRVLGSGSNGIGYYMYHGGATPLFDGRFYNEDGGFGLPKINYDYQSPLGQYGQPKRHFHTLNLLHLFLAGYGERLAPQATILPKAEAKPNPSNVSTLRYAARAAGGSGFIFLVNYQDHVQTQDLKGLQLQCKAGVDTVNVPRTGTFTLHSGASVILPVGLDVGGVTLRSATVQPLTICLTGGEERHVFFSVDGFAPELVFTKSTIDQLEHCEVREVPEGLVVTGQPGATFSFRVGGKSVLVIPRSLALQAAPGPDGRLLFVSGLATREGNSTAVYSVGKTDVSLQVYPKLDHEFHVQGAALTLQRGAVTDLAEYALSFPPAKLEEPTLRQVSERKYAVKLAAIPAGLHDVLLRVDYTGDTGMAFVGGQMIDDHFSYGRPWEIGLKRFESRLRNDEMVFVFRRMARNAPYLNDIPEPLRPVFAPGEESLLQVRGVSLVPEYKAVITWR